MNLGPRVAKYGIGIGVLLVAIILLVWMGFIDQESNPASIGMLGIIIFMIPLAIIIFLTVMMWPFDNGSLAPEINALDSQTSLVEPKKLTFNQKIIKGIMFWVKLIILTGLIFIGGIWLLSKFMSVFIHS